MKQKIKMLISDFDGVFTDGSVYVSNDGQEMIKCSRVDGLGIELLRNNGIKTVVITSDTSNAMKSRTTKLKIQTLSGIKDKIEAFNETLVTHNLTKEDVCVCGDDLPDLEMLNKSKHKHCPSNAVPMIKHTKGIIISSLKGGEGFIREVCDWIIKYNEGI